MWIATSVANAIAVNPYGIKTLLAKSVSTLFPIKCNPAFTNGPKILPKNSPEYPVLRNWIFKFFILAYEQFAKTLRSLETLLLEPPEYVITDLKLLQFRFLLEILTY